MKIFRLHKEQFLPIPIEEAWGFFSSAANLEKITPPDVGFETITELREMQIFDGMKIEYKLRPMMNIPMLWETEIADVSAPYRFKDKQRKGPYALWEHTHTFEKVTGGVMMTDDVKYALPLGWLGIIVHKIVVKKKLEEIFRFRRSALVKIFGEQGHL